MILFITFASFNFHMKLFFIQQASIVRESINSFSFCLHKFMEFHVHFPVALAGAPRAMIQNVEDSIKSTEKIIQSISLLWYFSNNFYETFDEISFTFRLSHYLPRKLNRISKIGHVN